MEEAIAWLIGFVLIMSFMAMIATLKWLVSHKILTFATVAAVVSGWLTYRDGQKQSSRNTDRCRYVKDGSNDDNTKTVNVTVMED